MSQLSTINCLRFATQVVVGQFTADAAHRDARRSKKPLIFAIRALTLSGLVLLFSAGCASGPKILVPESVIGRWRGVASGALLEFTPTGIFVVETKDGVTLLGRCMFQGTRVALRYQLGAAICPEEPGQYTLEIEGVNMRTADPSDTCFDRRIMMAQAWVREGK